MGQNIYSNTLTTINYLDSVNIKKYKRKINYYKQPHEIEAQIAGFKRKAKIQGRNIEDVMREFFNRRKEVYNLKQSTIDKIVARLMDEYIK